jgi:plastocyanin
MRQKGWKHTLIEAWAFVAVAIIAFAGGLLIGDLGSSPEKETVYVQASEGESEGEEAEAAEPSGEAAEPEAGGEEPAQGGAGGEPGAQVFTSAGCGSCHILEAAGTSGTTGPNLNEFLAPDDTTEAVEEMIVDPNAELAEGYPSNVMPQTYGQSMSPTEVHDLAEYLVANTPAKPNATEPPKKSSGGAKQAAGNEGAGETLQLTASPTELAFDTEELSGKAGKVTIDFENPAAIEHDVAIEQNGKVIAKSPLIKESKTSVSAALKPGTYTFICTVPGHAEAGMEGTLVIK